MALLSFFKLYFDKRQYVYYEVFLLLSLLKKIISISTE